MVQRRGRRKEENKEERERERLVLEKERGIVTTLDPTVSRGSSTDDLQQSVLGVRSALDICILQRPMSPPLVVSSSWWWVCGTHSL